MRSTKEKVSMEKGVDLHGIYNEIQRIGDHERELLEEINLSAIERVANVYSSEYLPIEQMQKTFGDIAKDLASQLGGLSIDLSSNQKYELMYAQTRAFSLIQQSITTQMLTEIRKSLKVFDMDACVRATINEFSKSLVDIANVAFIKLSRNVSLFSQNVKFPVGFSTALRQMNVGTARRVAKCDDISYEPLSRSFVVNSNPTSKVTSSELNVLCSGADILDDFADNEDEIIGEAELMNFISILSETPGFASENIVGRKIFHLINNLAECIDFDKALFYHSRKLAENSCPYPINEMLRAPTGVSGPGRYNHPGRSHYYFADTQEGAVNEVRKYNNSGKIQTAVIAPKASAKILDLSSTLRGGVTFLRFVRFPVEQINSALPREYLIPCYVSDCCRHSNIDGIKYYGGAEYMNYVCWNDGYFRFVEMAPLDE